MRDAFGVERNDLSKKAPNSDIDINTLNTSAGLNRAIKTADVSRQYHTKKAKQGRAAVVAGGLIAGGSGLTLYHLPRAGMAGVVGGGALAAGGLVHMAHHVGRAQTAAHNEGVLFDVKQHRQYVEGLAAGNAPKAVSKGDEIPSLRPADYDYPGDNRAARRGRNREKAGLATAGVGALIATRGKEMAPGTVGLVTPKSGKLTEAEHAAKVTRRAERFEHTAGKAGAVLAAGGLLAAGAGLAQDWHARGVIPRAQKHIRNQLQGSNIPMVKSAFGVEDIRLAKAWKFPGKGIYGNVRQVTAHAERASASAAQHAEAAGQHAEDSARNLSETTGKINALVPTKRQAAIGAGLAGAALTGATYAGARRGGAAVQRRHLRRAGEAQDRKVVGKASGPVTDEERKPIPSRGEASPGRIYTAASFPAIHGAVAGKPGHKLRAAVNEGGGAALGGLAGTAAGMALSRGRFAPSAAALGAGGGTFGALMGLQHNVKQGHLKPDPGKLTRIATRVRRNQISWENRRSPQGVQKAYDPETQRHRRQNLYSGAAAGGAAVAGSAAVGLGAASRSKHILGTGQAKVERHENAVLTRRQGRQMATFKQKTPPVPAGKLPGQGHLKGNITAHEAAVRAGNASRRSLTAARKLRGGALGAGAAAAALGATAYGLHERDRTSGASYVY